MKWVILASLIVSVLVQNAFALKIQEDRYANELIVLGSKETLNSEYEKAIGHAHELITLYPREPFPRFMLSTIYMYMLRSYWNFPKDQRYRAHEEAFERASAEALRACDEYPVQDAMIYYVRGMVLGTEGMVRLQNHNWLDAYSKGKAGVAALERSLELDPTYYDAYLGLGMFEYYCSKLSGVVKVLAWIVGLSGDSKKGIEYVSIAMNRGRYAEGPAKVFLAYVLIDFENDLYRGVELARSLRAAYPRNYVFIEYLLRAAEKLPPERASEGIKWIEDYIKTPNWEKGVILFAPFNLDRVDYVEARLYMNQDNYRAAWELMEPLSAKTSVNTEFGTEVNLALLLIYTKLKSREKAQQIHSLIMANPSVNDSHARAKGIFDQPP